MPDDPKEPAEDALEVQLKKLMGEAGARFPEPPSEAEINARLGRGEDAKPEDDPVEARMREIEERARVAKAGLPPTANRAVGSSSGEGAGSNPMSGLAFGLSIAYTLTGLPVGGLLIGLLIDRVVGTQGWAAMLLILGAGAGVALAIRALVRRSP